MVKKQNKKSVKEDLSKQNVKGLTEKPIKSPILSLVIKFFILSTIILIGIIYADKKGYFNPDQKDNHTLKKWNSY